MKDFTCNMSIRATVILLFLYVQAIGQNPATSFVKVYGANSNYEYSYDMVQDLQGNLFVCGYTEGPIDLDPGSGIQMMNTNGSLTTFLQKFDKQGILIWARSWLDGVFCIARGLNVDQHGNIYITGGFGSNTFDADPTGGYFPLYGNSQTNNFFLIKLDGAGSFKWAVVYEGGNTSFSPPIIGSAGQVTISTNFVNNIDADPDPINDSIVSAHTPNKPDLFIQQLDSSGVVKWTRIMRGDGWIEPHAAIADLNDEILISGGFKDGSIDFNPDNNAALIADRNSSNFQGFVVRLSNTGTFRKLSLIEGNGSSVITDLTRDQYNNIYTAGFHFGMIDLDPGPAYIPPISRNGFTDGNFFQKLDQNHNLLWHKNHSGQQISLYFERVARIAVDELGYIYAGGSFYDSIALEPAKPMGKWANDKKRAARDFVVTKIDPVSDSLVWYYSPEAYDYGSLYFRTIIPNRDRVYITGKIFSLTLFDGGTPKGLNNDMQLYFLALNNCEITPYSESVYLTVCDHHTFPNGSSVYGTGKYSSNTVLKSIYGCDSVYQTINVTVQNSQMPQISQFPGSLEIIPSPYYTKVQWYDCSNEVILQGDTSEIFIVPANGSYALIFSDTTGCIDTSQCYYFHNIELMEYKGADYLAYPNPVKDNIYLGEDLVSSVEIIDPQGRLVLKRQLVKDVNVAHLARGTYLIKIHTAEGVSVLKFLKE